MKKGYFVYEKDELVGIGVVAKNITDAKQWVYGSNSLECDWIDIRVKVMKDIDVEGLDYGIIELYEGLKRGFYSYIDDGKCEICGNEDEIQYNDEKFVCGECYDKIVLGDKT